MPILPSGPKNKTRTCRICGESKYYISRILSLCYDCICDRPHEALPYITGAHIVVRNRVGLPASPPKTDEGVMCGTCSNQCLMGEGERGYCGLRWLDHGLRSHVDPSRGLIHAYLDPHVTNCCSAWFCPAGTGAGYPTYSNLSGPEIGFYNLAVFFYGCNFNCLFCQNPSHKDFSKGSIVETVSLVRRITSNPKISCVCFFGGSPEPQLPFSISLSERALELVKNRPLRICFEWNGCGDTSLVKKAAELALKSGGNIKFDLKCFTPNLSLALSGVENIRAYENFANLAGMFYDERPKLPVLTATTLLVPGYVNSSEVEAIAKFIADHNPSIPYSLLVFHPAYQMNDLPVTPMKQVVDCYVSACKHLESVHVGNLHLLGIQKMANFVSITGTSSG